MKTSSQDKAVKRFCGELLSIHSRAIREHLTDDRITELRADLRKHTNYDKWTRADHAQARGYERALFDIMWTLVEWRLGTEETGPVDAGQWKYSDKADGTRNLPTHGAHFWKGTDKEYTKWAPRWQATLADCK